MTQPSQGVVFRPLQSRFLDIPQAPLCYWLRKRLFELLSGTTLGDVAAVCQGLATANDARFIRMTWEVPPDAWTLDVRNRRWVPFEKGGGYGKWFGHHFWVVDWQYNGSRIRHYPGAYLRNESCYFKEGWTYSWVARGSLGLRFMSTKGIIAGAASSGIYPHTAYPGLGAILNCRFASQIVRSISAKIQLPESYVSRIPLPNNTMEPIAWLESSCLRLKSNLTAMGLTERSFDFG